MDRQDDFCREFSAYIKRAGSEKVLGWLLRSDFFTAPASTKYHSAVKGGLCLHSLLTFYRLRALWIAEYGAESLTEKVMESLAICALLHDICKVDYYTVAYKNVKDEAKDKWNKEPFYTVNDQLPYGHGEKSVYILMTYMELTEEEAMAIRWHMGGFDDSANGSVMAQAFRKYPLALLLHIADMQANYFDEEEGVKFV